MNSDITTLMTVAEEPLHPENQRLIQEKISSEQAKKVAGILIGEFGNLEPEVIQTLAQLAKTERIRTRDELPAPVSELSAGIATIVDRLLEEKSHAFSERPYHAAVAFRSANLGGYRRFRDSYTRQREAVSV